MNVCLVLGAGASLANVLHFRAERMRSERPPLDTTFFETVDARRIALSTWLRAYFRDYLGIDPTPTTLREYRMEEIFADVSFDFRETPSDQTARNAYIDLVDLYLRVLRETTNWLCEDGRTGGPVGRLIAEAAREADRVTIITFNHDLVIENELLRRTALKRRWCLDQGYGEVSSELQVAYPRTGGQARFPLHQDGLCDHDRPITLLKLHGSVNWRVRINSQRPTARTLRGEGGARQVLLLARREITGRQAYVRSPEGPGRHRWILWPVVVPPVYAKQSLRSGTIQLAWDQARDALERADRVVFFGYSLPQLDVEAEKIFERSLTKNKTAAAIDVINPAPASAARFAEVAADQPVRWYSSLPQFLGAGGFH